MKTVTGAKLWVRTFAEDGEQKGHWADLQKRRPARLKASYWRQKAALDFMKARWDKQPSKPTGTVDEK